MRSLAFAVLPFVCLIGLVGCVPPGQSPADPSTEVSPFCDPAAGPNCCPDGQCPSYQAASLGQEIGAGGSTLVNMKAAVEPKGQTCPNCPQRPANPVVVHRQPATYQPAAQPARSVPKVWPPIRLNPGEVLLSVGPTRPTQPEAGRLMPRPQQQPAARPAPTRRTDPSIKEGVFRCQRCNRSTVGREWHEVWADDGTPLTCLCNLCWYAISPAQRSAELQRFARGRIRGDLSPIVKDAIREASQK